MEISCAAILFDMDGVLIDSTPAVARVWSEWARERGFDPEKVVRMAHGRPSISTIRDLLPNADHEAEDREVERREVVDLEGGGGFAGSQTTAGQPHGGTLCHTELRVFPGGRSSPRSKIKKATTLSP